MKSLYQHLADYSAGDYYGFHMPGHKRNINITGAKLPYDIDITEIDSFDDLHHASGIIKAYQERAAHVYGAEETHYLVGGSTAGILSAVMGCTGRGDKVLMSRNCHKSVYNAAVMKELDSQYLYPRYYEDTGLNGEVSVDDVTLALDTDPDIKVVVVVSPTYDGAVSDVGRIAAAVHERGLPLIVDEAHGAHFGFHRAFPENANRLGADVVIHSLHKTMPALTQTGLLHLNGDIVNRERVRDYLQMLQSSSPSYILMAGIEACINLLEREGAQRFRQYAADLQELRSTLRGLNNLQLIETPRYDDSKIVISTMGTGISGKELFNCLLREYHLQLEMAAGSYVIAMTSMADTKAGFERLTSALKAIDAGLISGLPGNAVNRLPRMKKIYTEAKMQICAKEMVEALPWRESIGHIASERAYLYPPGIPLILPGERISAAAVETLEKYRSLDFEIQGLKDREKIEVLIDG